MMQRAPVDTAHVEYQHLPPPTLDKKPLPSTTETTTGPPPLKQPLSSENKYYNSLSDNLPPPPPPLKQSLPSENKFFDNLPPPPPKHLDQQQVLDVSPIPQKTMSGGLMSQPQSIYSTLSSTGSATSLSLGGGGGPRQPQPQQPHSPTPSSQPMSGEGSTRSSSVEVASVATTTNEQLLDHSHLKPGNKASLLSYAQTINMYRENAKKTNNPDIQCDFAIFMVEAAKPLLDDEIARWEYLSEAEKLLKQLASRGHAESQYYLGNLYASGLLSRKGKNEFDKAFPLFVQATKHHHADAAYRAAKCYEDGLGTRRDSSKAVQFYRKAATLSHPGAMYRLGVAEVNGELGISKNARDGVKWLKRASEAATTEYPHAIHELALLHEKGIDNVVFLDLDYAVSLYAQAAELGYAPSAFRLGECYEYGKLNCRQDPALSIHYYTIAAQQGHREACFALTAWYLVGSPEILPQSDQDAYVWARRAAEKGLPKAEYAVGYFTEVGIGTVRNLDEAMHWYKLAADHGDKRAIQRLQGKSGESQQQDKNKKGGQDDCTIM